MHYCDVSHRLNSSKGCYIGDYYNWGRLTSHLDPKVDIWEALWAISARNFLVPLAGVYRTSTGIVATVLVPK